MNTSCVQAVCNGILLFFSTKKQSLFFYPFDGAGPCALLSPMECGNCDIVWILETLDLKRSCGSSLVLLKPSENNAVKKPSLVTWNMRSHTEENELTIKTHCQMCKWSHFEPFSCSQDIRDPIQGRERRENHTLVLLSFTLSFSVPPYSLQCPNLV